MPGKAPIAPPNGVDQGIWTAILQWSLRQHDPENAGNENVKPLSKEDRDFLMDAFDSIIVDEKQRMLRIKDVLSLSEESKEIAATREKIATHIVSLQAMNNTQIRKLKEKKTSEHTAILDGLDEEGILHLIESKKLAALSELDDLCLGIDNSMNFSKLGGIRTLIWDCLVSKSLKVRAAAAQALGTIVQNNPKCQESALSLDAISQLWHLISYPIETKVSNSTSEEEAVLVEKVQAKGLFALGCLIRDFSPGLVHFVRVKGVNLLYKVLMHPSTRIRAQRKNLNLLNHIWEKVGSARQTASYAIPSLLQFLNSTDVDLAEASLKGLVELSTNNQTFVTLLKQDGLNPTAADAISARLATLNAETDPDFIEWSQEEKATLQALLAKVQ